MTARVAKRSSRAAEEAEQEVRETSTPPTTSPYETAVAADVDVDSTALGPPRKRKRRVVSCAECHRRKQKCDRNQPCRACVDRKMEASCRYETTAMSHERHHMRVIEAATFGRALQAAGTLPVKAAGFGYVQSADNTLGFLRKLDGGAGHGHRLHGLGGFGGLDGIDGLDTLSGLVEDGHEAPVVTTTAAEAAALAEKQYVESQSSPPITQVQTQTQAQAQALSTAQNINQLHSQHAHMAAAAAVPTGDPYGVADRYKALIRQLPPWQYVDRLVDTFFRDFNWNYYALDEDIFRKQMTDWKDVSTGHFGALQAPHQLSPDLRAFPALLFEVLALGLLMLPPGEPTAFFEAIKHPASSTTLENVAMTYSETSMGLLALLGKRQMSLTTVSAAFLRAAFLKYVALITEAWHAVGSAIRDAQEIGLHTSSMDPKPWTQSAEAVLENQWEIQRRRRMWMTLVSWDVQMGVVLGRPTTVDLLLDVVLPVDCILPTSLAERATMSVQPRGENDPPTPLSRAIWAFGAITPLRAILELEKQGPVPRDFAAVDRLHDELIQVQEAIPPYFRLENPDTRFDELSECYWLPAIRVTVPQVTIFNRIALHRHYIFTRARSRLEAVRACLAMLSIQRVHFSQLKPQQYRMFSLFFGTFDSLVLMATIYILFPKEHPELVPDVIQHFRWSVERFELMADHFSLARSALGVLQAIYLRLRKTLGVHFLEGDCTAAGMGGAVGSAPIDPLTLSNIDPSLKDAGPLPATATADGPRNSISDSVHGSSTSSSGSAANGLTPGGLSSASGPSSAASDVLGAAAAAAASTVVMAAAPADPNLDPALGGPVSAFDSTQEALTELDSIFPDGFDWTSFQPICPTGDLTYNILMGVSNGNAMPGWGISSGEVADVGVGGLGDGLGDGVSVGVGVGGSVDETGDGSALDLGVVTSASAEAAAAATSIDGTAVPWQFEGDFASNSLWGLLNSYTPF